MEAVEIQDRPETLEDIAHGLDTVAGMHYPHPACPREYNEMARKGLKDLSVRIRAARDRELANIRAAAKAALQSSFELMCRVELGQTISMETRDAVRAIMRNCMDII